MYTANYAHIWNPNEPSPIITDIIYAELKYSVQRVSVSLLLECNKYVSAGLFQSDEADDSTLPILAALHTRLVLLLIYS
jgi:hypothetical protein